MHVISDSCFYKYLYLEFLFSFLLFNTKFSKSLSKFELYIPGVPKKAEQSISVTLIFKNIAYFDFIR